jgi:hypothetical protein
MPSPSTAPIFLLLRELPAPATAPAYFALLRRWLRAELTFTGRLPFDYLIVVFVCSNVRKNK